MVAERGLVISAGKMSGWWSGHPTGIKFAELDVICVVLGCGADELLLPEPETVAAPDSAAEEQATVVGQVHAVRPRSHTGRSMPPR